MTNILKNGQEMSHDIMKLYKSRYPIAVCNIIDYITVLVSETTIVDMDKQHKFFLLEEIYDNKVEIFEILMNNINTSSKGNVIPMIEAEIQKLVRKKNVA